MYDLNIEYLKFVSSKSVQLLISSINELIPSTQPVQNSPTETTTAPPAQQEVPAEPIPVVDNSQNSRSSVVGIIVGSIIFAIVIVGVIIGAVYYSRKNKHGHLATHSFYA